MKQQNQSILRPSYLSKEPFKVPRAQSCNSQTRHYQLDTDENRTNSNDYCKCDKCDIYNRIHYRNYQDNIDNKKINDEGYSRIYVNKNNKEKNFFFDNKQSFNNQTSSYSPRYQRRYDRARTTSPRHEMYQNRRHEKEWHREAEFDNKQNSSSAEDSGRSSATSSFSPLSSHSSVSQLSALGPLKKVTRKSRFVSIHDGRPVSCIL